MKEKRIVIKFNDKCFIYKKTKHATRNYRNRSQQMNPKKGRIAQSNITEVNDLIKKVSKMILYFIVSKVNHKQW